MHAITVFISCGADMNAFRDLALGVIRALENITLQMRLPVVLQNWDFRDSPPEVVPSGQLAARSLQMLEQSQLLVGILGADIPTVTSQEIDRALDLYISGGTMQVMIFIVEAAKGPIHDDFLADIKQRHGLQVIYQEFASELDFQRKLFVALTPHILGRALELTTTPSQGRPVQT